MGQKVSNPFARVHCPSDFCRSRAVTSFTATMPRMAPTASSSETFDSRAPITTPISPSYSTCALIGCSTIASPLAITALGGLRKRSGRSGTSFPISRACSR